MLAFRLLVVAAALLPAGCAITNYPLITDSDGDGSFIVSTNGKAVIVPTFQGIIIHSDQAEELFSMVDQKPNGDQTLTTYVSVSPTTDPTFLDFTYCTPDWKGCASWTAPNPAVGDDDIFDGRMGSRCSGFRSIELLVSFSARSRECGRLVGGASLEQLAELISSRERTQRYGRPGYDVRFHRGNTTLELTPLAGGAATSLPVPLTHGFLGDDRKAMLWTSPRIAPLRKRLAALHADHPEGFEARLRYEGVELTFPVSFTENIARPRY